MIPPVNIRQVRPCESCHCYWEAECGHDGIGCSIEGPRSEKYNPKDRNGYLETRLEGVPCPLHLTPDEYRQAADMGLLISVH